MSSCLIGLCLAAGQVPLPPGEVLPVPSPLAPPAIVVPALPDRPLSLCEFANTFRPCPGVHHVCLIHPCKKCPVPVCFSLPPGCPRVCVGKMYVTFDYGCRKVTLRCTLFGGKVKVLYN